MLLINSRILKVFKKYKRNSWAKIMKSVFFEIVFTNCVFVLNILDMSIIIIVPMTPPRYISIIDGDGLKNGSRGLLIFIKPLWDRSKFNTIIEKIIKEHVKYLLDLSKLMLYFFSSINWCCEVIYKKRISNCILGLRKIFSYLFIMF